MKELVVDGTQGCLRKSTAPLQLAGGRPRVWVSSAPQESTSTARRSCCTATLRHTGEAQTSKSSWFTQPVEYVGAVETPSREASMLEETFWHHPVMEVPATRDEAMVMMERLHQETAAQASSDGVNVVAFTGGNGPALTAYLLNNLFDGSVVGCIGNPLSMQPQQVEHARFVADLLGIDLVEVDDQTWSRFEIPEGLDTDADELCTTMGAASCEEAGLAMFSGATADDVAPFTHGGGEMHGIVAPLATLSRAAVNSLTKIVGLPQFQEQASGLY